MTREEIKDSFWEAISETTNISWVFADQADESQKLPYGTLKITALPSTENPIDEERFSVTGEKLFVETGGQSQFTLALQVFGPGAIDILLKLTKTLKTTNFRYFLAGITRLKGFELALIDIGAIQDISALLQSDYEERAGLDLVYRVADSMTEEMTTIDQLKDVESVYKNQADEVVHSDTETIDL